MLRNRHRRSRAPSEARAAAPPSVPSAKSVVTPADVRLTATARLPQIKSPRRFFGNPATTGPSTISAGSFPLSLRLCPFAWFASFAVKAASAVGIN